MSIWLADVNGKIVKAIVDRNFKKFCMKVSDNKNVHHLMVIVLLDIKSVAVCHPIVGSQFIFRLFLEAFGHWV